MVSGTLLNWDLETSRGLLTTDLGRPVFFDVPKAYLFETVAQGGRVTLQLDEQGRAIKVMDTAITDFVPAVIAGSRVATPPLTSSWQPPLSSLGSLQ